MFYAGKRLDQFEPAFLQMLAYEGIEPIDYLDCISKRSFGFAADVQEKERFSPFITLKEAISYLSLELNLQLKYKKIKSIDEIPQNAKAMVLGPLKEGIAVKGIQNYYYDGKCCYIFAKQAEHGQFRVFDPQGIPELAVSKETMANIISQSTPYSIFLQNSGNNFKKPTKKHIFQEGMKYHNLIKSRESEGLVHMADRYQKGHGNAITLQYGIINACLQIDKNFLLSEECQMLAKEAEKEYFICKRELYKAVQKEKLQNVPQIWNRIWELLEYGLQLVQNG